MFAICFFGQRLLIGKTLYIFTLSNIKLSMIVLVSGDGYGVFARVLCFVEATFFLYGGVKAHNRSLLVLSARLVATERLILVFFGCLRRSVFATKMGSSSS